jgi:hypothetical protein
LQRCRTEMQDIKRNYPTSSKAPGTPAGLGGHLLLFPGIRDSLET